LSPSYNLLVGVGASGTIVASSGGALKGALSQGERESEREVAMKQHDSIRYHRRRRGFTLIEVLAVLFIIAIMAAAIFALVPYTKKVVERQRCRKEVEVIRMAIEEYHSTFGVYPPAIGAEYEYHWNDPVIPPDDWHYKSGLVWHLSVGPGKERWARYNEQIPYAGGWIRYDDEWKAPDPFSPQMHLIWSNHTQTIHDPWFQSYQYEVGPDFQSYRLWSYGPPGDHDGSIGYKDFVQ